MKVIEFSKKDVWQLVHWQRLYRINPQIFLDKNDRPAAKFGGVQFPLGHLIEKREDEK